jgi:hypothetical protein
VAVAAAMFLVMVAGALVIQAGKAEAAGIKEFSMSPSTTQAGGHPDWEIKVGFENRTESEAKCGCADVEIITISAPTGFIGNPHALPKCTLLQFSLHKCPSEAQVGIASIGLGFSGGQQAMYNLEPHPNQAGLVGFEAPLINSPVFIDLNARTESDYGLNSTSQGIFHLLPLSGLSVFLWGVPADSSHDRNRFPNPQGGFGCFTKYPEPCGPPIPFNGPAEPYLQNPTTCGIPLTGGLDLRYYDGSEFHADAPWPATTGCEQLSFNPSLTASGTTSQADSPGGLDVKLVVPQVQSPTTPSQSELRTTTVTLPEGFSINPNAADGKQACSDVAGAFGTRGPAVCHEHAKVGTVTLDSSALPGPIDGAIYLGEPKPGDKYRLFLTASGFATNVKLAGSVRTDPQTGQIVVEFLDLPQSPLSEFDMHFFGAERGLLATPERCGTYAVESEFVPWDNALPNQTSTSFFTIDSGPNGSPCPGATRPFEPTLRAGTSDHTAGQFAAFHLKLTRSDGDQNLSGLDLTTPPGLLASLAGVPYCPESALDTLEGAAHTGVLEQSAPACPAASLIGTAMTSEGAGSLPLHTPGKVYLAGPYKGAPLSLVIVVPAVSGPYDLGNVAVRTAVGVDPVSARIEAVSDPLPQILDGIPLRLRSVLVSLDRPNFTLNPTNCDPFSVDAVIHGDEGGHTSQSPHFQTANCTDLDFAPKFGLKLRGSTKHLGHPSLRAVVRPQAGQANIRRTVVAMPKSLLLDNSHIGTVCTRIQFAQEACPADSVYGSATAFTPLLDEALSGPVYLRSSGRKLPDLVADLEGQIDIELSGHIDTAKNGGLRSTFGSVPDAPVSMFVLDMQGGDKGLLVNSSSLCKGTKRARVTLVGQNGLREARRTKVQTGCGSSAKRSRGKGRVHQARTVR